MIIPKTAFALPVLLAACAQQVVAAGSAQPAAERPDPVLLPSGALYSPYLADPHEREISLDLLLFTRRDIPDAGATRLDVRLGGRLGLIQFRRRGAVWRISAEGGFRAQFDNRQRQDNIGWDGNYGLAVESRRSAALATKLFLLHTSSHIGDEYAEATGRRRINYTREEVGVAVSWYPVRRWRAYGETGFAYRRGNRDLQAPWRVQGGVEYEERLALWGEQLGWYAAADLSAMEERDWRLDRALGAGLAFHGSERSVRLGLRYVNGRPSIGEFFQRTEEYLSLRLVTHF